MNMFISVLSSKPWVACRSGKLPGLVLAGMLMLAGISANALPTVTSVTDSNHGKAGYVDGSTFLVAQFHTPVGIAIDETYDCLYVADRDNNAIRMLDLGAGYTSTIFPNTYVPASLISKPVGVQVDSDGNIFVLNRGSTNSFSTNGTVLEFDYLFNLVATNATKLTNATSIALDSADNIYVTVRSNSVIQISPSGAITNIATITNTGTYLQGIVVKHNGLLAVSDSGRNGVYLINPANGLVTTNAGFNGAGDYTGINNRGAVGAAVKFFQPSGLAEAGDGSLIVADTGNNRVKVIGTTGIVTNLYGVSSIYWSGTTPGWLDGTVKVPDSTPNNVQARLPVGLAFANDGTLYTTEDYYHLIRKVTGSGLPQPTQQPSKTQVAVPIIGWVSFPPPENLSVFNALTGASNSASAVFNNYPPALAIEKGDPASQVFFTSGQTPSVGSIPDPGPTSGSTPPVYPGDGSISVPDLPGTRYPDMTIKAIGTKSDGSPNSAIVQARIQFITANPIITGLNAAQFTVSDITIGALMYYTTDGSIPTSDGSGTSTGPITNGEILSINIVTNTAFQIKAFNPPNFQDSSVVTNVFSPTNFVANTISFGFASGEASSDFVASPGETFYAPVTLSILSDTIMYSLQFNMTVTNAGPNPGPPIAPGAFNFSSMLVKPISGTTPTAYEQIPPFMFIGDAVNPPPPGQIVSYNGNEFIDLEVANTNLNLLAVGWLERAGAGETNLYNTKSQDLIQYSQAHDTLFGQANGKIIVGGYAFLVPTNTLPGQTYQIQLGRPSATSDGVGAPGSLIYIATPTNGSLVGGSLNSIKVVTAGQRKYLVGDAYPFRWFNAGDFGNTNLENADVEQVFQSAIYGYNYPLPGSDFADSMDSCGAFGVTNSGKGYLTKAATLSTGQVNALFNGNDTTINQIAFGDGNLDVADVYVTYRRSLDPSLTWYRRFWTNGVLAAETVPNIYTPNIVSKVASKAVSKVVTSGNTNTIQPKIDFAATDIQGSAGQTIQVPITATILGSYPLRVLMLNLTVEPLDGSPALTTAVSFTPNSILGTPTLTGSDGNGNYAAAWLNNAITGLTSNANIGTLTVTIPANATSSSAYAVHFDHASASPNGLASFPKETLTGLVLLSSRTNSSYGDGIPDSWRLRWFGTTNNLLSVSNACPSGDGINNYQKFVAGVDPSIAGDFPSLNSQAPVPSGFTSSIHWQTKPNIQYVIERSSSLFSGTWTAIATNTGTGGDMEFHDNNAGAVKFYRVQILP
jgi:hypothetical protein